MKIFFAKRKTVVTSIVLALSILLSTLTCVAAVSTTENDTDITYWDGWNGDEYASLEAVQNKMTGDGSEANPYIITDADQLYAVIYYGGGDFVSLGNSGTCYKLANDLYLNENYLDYADWDNTAPANKWMSNDGSTDFNGTIDGDGHTIYGYYNEGSQTALIPYNDSTSDVTVYVKNLNMKYCAAKEAGYFVSFVFAGAPGGGSGGNQIFIDNCMVRNSEMSGIGKTAGAGAILGITGRRAIIDNCAVTDVVFNYSGANRSDAGLDRSNEHSIGAIVGSAQSGAVNVVTKHTDGGDATTMADNIYITLTNSYSVNNILNLSNSSYKVYPIGIYQKWSEGFYCAMAENVYTDSTTIPAYTFTNNNITYNIKLRVAAVGSNTEIPSDSENYPIKTISADLIKGENAKTVMPELYWLYWSTVADGYPVPVGNAQGKLWDGWNGDEYASLEAVQNKMTGDGSEANPYIITDADQLYAVIYYGGGNFVSVGNSGTCYKLANDLYLNENYLDYADWDNTAPANKWMSNDGSTDFNGTIDGDGHTIYGYYNTLEGSGLIPYNDSTSNVTVYVKNLNMAYGSIALSKWNSAFIFAGTPGGGSGGNQVFIDNCTVRNSEMSDIYKSSCNGAIVGVAGRRTVINNCAVTDVTFNYSGSNRGSGLDRSNEQSIGAIIGGAQSGTVDLSKYSDATTMATDIYITVTNSYSVNNILNLSNSSYKVYPIGIYQSWTNSYYCAMVENVYTDSTTIPAYTFTNNSITYDIKLRVAAVGSNTEISSDSENYPIKVVSTSNLIGEGAKIAMPELDWALYWSTVPNYYPIPEDKSAGKVWDGTKNTTIDGLGMAGSGTQSDPYVITNGTQLYAAIFSGGGGHYYVLANDIVLNSDYKNYKSWGSTAPANSWYRGSSYDFIGQMDGQGYTIYGYYSHGDCAGLFPSINGNPYAESVIIKNINMSHCYMGGANGYNGFIVGNTDYKGGSRKVVIDGCNVRNGIIADIADNANTGGIIGGIRNTSCKVTNCSVANVTFTAKGDNSVKCGWNSIGSIVGSVHTANTFDGSFNAEGAKRVQITNSFAVDCIRTNDSATLYPVGMTSEDYTSNSVTYQNFFLSFAADNIYTDADVINDMPKVTTSNTQTGEEITFTLKVASTADTTTAIDPTSDNFPIKNVSDIMGNNAKTAMPDLNWCHFDTVTESVPVWADNHTVTEVAAVEPTCTETGLTAGSVCSKCNETIITQSIVTAKGHDWSGEWTVAEDGKVLTCKGCDEAKFKAELYADGVGLTSEAEVFAVGTDINIQSITSGDIYDSVQSAMPVLPKEIAVYEVSAMLDGNEAQFNGNAKLSIDIPVEWDSTNVVVCQLTSSGNLRKTETTVDNGVASANIGVGGVYALINLSVDFIGDVDGDGNVDTDDMALLRKHLLEYADEILGTADTNCDGKVNICDLVTIYNYLVG